MVFAMIFSKLLLLGIRTLWLIICGKIHALFHEFNELFPLASPLLEKLSNDQISS